MTNSPVARCPRCEKQIIWDDSFPFRPFCSERCHMIDLGGWLNEEHRIAGQPEDGGEGDGEQDKNSGN